MNFIKELRWHPAFGDPTFMGWFTVAGYGVAALLATRVWWIRREKLWLLVAFGMAVLCINKQLDLQSLLTDIGRIFSKHAGWYSQRRLFQKFFVAFLIAISGVAGIWSIWRHHDFWKTHKLLAAGCLFLLTFIVVRGISFHHVDVFTHSPVAVERMNQALELGGIFLVGLAAARAARSPE